MSPFPVGGGVRPGGSSGGGESSGFTPVPKDGVIKPADTNGPPREGSRETNEGRIISVLPDWCYKGYGAAQTKFPYNIYAFQKDATNLADSVRQTSNRSHAK